MRPSRRPSRRGKHVYFLLHLVVKSVRGEEMAAAVKDHTFAPR